MKIFLTRAFTQAIAQLTIATALVACNTIRPPTAASPLPDVVSDPVAGSPSPIPTAIGDPFMKGVDKAASASNLAQSAQTAEDWNLVITQWRRAIDLMKAVPSSDPNHTAAQKLLVAYQQDLARAQQQAKRGGASQGTAVVKGNADGGIPVIANEQPSTSPDNASDTAVAITTVNALLQQQTEFFAKQKRFAGNLAELAGSIPADTPSYSYGTSVLSKQAIATAAAKQSGLPSYTGALLLIKDDKNNDTTVTTICVTTKPVKVPPGAPQVVGKEIQCPSGSSKL